MAQLGPAQVLQALAGLVVDGVDPLGSGWVQDVAIEWHGETAYVGVHVDELWNGAPPPPAVMEAMRQRVLALPPVGAVRIIPRSAERARQAQDLARRRAAGAPLRLPEGARFLAVQSGKGGVGKSTVSVNLAVALRRLGVPTGLLDCDIYGFSAPALIGVEGRPELRGRLLIPPQAHGVAVMSMDYFVRAGQAVMWRGPMLGKALRQMTEETAWDGAQALVLDLPPGTGDVALDVQRFFPQAQVVVVTTPDPAAAKVAARAGLMARQVGHRLLGVVENLAYATCSGCGQRQALWGEGGGLQVAEALGVPLLAQIPWYPEGVGGREAVAPEGSPAGATYAALAGRLWQELTAHGAARDPGAALPAGTPTTSRREG
jgi:ATP-binding protein involved in chromosome partitioning